MGLFDEQVSRKPNLYPWTQDIINGLWHTFWTPNEFNFKADHSQFYNEMTAQERGVIVRTLSAIGQVEIAVKRFWADLGKTFRHPSMSDMGLVMGNNEVIHNQAYEKLLDVLQLQNAFDEALKEPVILGRITYLRRHLDKVYADDRKQFVYALVLFTLFVENTSLFGQFYVIMHFNRFRSLLKDTAQQVQYTRIEEQLHAQAGIILINTLRQEYPDLFDEDLKAQVQKECLDAVTHEGRIIDWILQGYEDRNLSTDILKTYIKDRLSKSMIEAGFEGLPHSPDDINTLQKTFWMDEEIKGVTLTDFFQKKPTEYGKNNRSYNEEDLF